MRAVTIRSIFPENLRTGLETAQLPALDGLRAVAAFLVVFHHNQIPGVSGALGVLVFFVLSGFLITWLLLSENERSGSVSLRDFYMRRTLRIFPAFYCYWLLLTTALLLLNKRVIWGQSISALLYVNNYYQAIHGDPNTVFSITWSLGVEEQFYLLWPITFLLLRNDSKRMARVLLGIILAVWLYREALHFAFRVSQGYIYEAFDTRADHLMIGCLLAVVLRARFFPAFWKGLCRTVPISMCFAGLIVLSTTGEYLYGTDYRDAIGFLVDPVIVALLIPQFIAFRTSSVWSWLNWPWVCFLGRISYSIYLYHGIAGALVRRPLASSPFPIGVAGAVAATVVVAAASYFIVEQPFLRLKDRFRREAGVPTARL